MGCVAGSFLLRLFSIFREGGVSERRVTSADGLEARLLDGRGFIWLPGGGAVLWLEILLGGELVFWFCWWVWWQGFGVMLVGSFMVVSLGSECLGVVGGLGVGAFSVSGWVLFWGVFSGVGLAAFLTRSIRVTQYIFSLKTRSARYCRYFKSCIELNPCPVNNRQLPTLVVESVQGT